MSGGAFNYAYSRVEHFADELGLRISEYSRVNEYGEAPDNFSAHVREKLRKIERLARATAAMMKEAEWLYSGDTSEESFMVRISQIDMPEGESS